MYLLLIGHSVLDTVIYSDSKTIKPGGVYYSAYGLNLIRGKNDIVKLLTFQDAGSKSYFEKLYNQFDNNLIKVVDKIPNVHLTVFDEGEREEKYLNFVDKLDISPIKNEKYVDGILLNMITGLDVNLNDLIELKRLFNCPIYLDIHTLARRADESNFMQFALIKDADVWLSNVDIVQANENELRSIKNHQDESVIAEYVLSFNPKILIVTKGKLGSTAYIKQGNRIQTIYCKAVEAEAINKVGCGDIFGAVFFYTYLKTNSVETALNLANTVAGFSTKSESLQDLFKLLSEENFLND
jgi:sugar/nucleoside kinase (ribokinase family)